MIDLIRYETLYQILDDGKTRPPSTTKIIHPMCVDVELEFGLSSESKFVRYERISFMLSRAAKVERQWLGLDSHTS